MSVRTIYEAHCDGPDCLTTAFYRSGTELPEGWVWLSSAAHIQGPMGSGRRKVESSDRKYGSFRLHLCPDHTAAFDGHRPRTEGQRAVRREDPSVVVACECGWSGWTRACTMVEPSGVERPRYLPERAWWAHLPEELRAYHARREAAKAA